MLNSSNKPLWYHEAKHARDVARRIMSRRFPTPRLDVITDDRDGIAKAYIIVLGVGRDGRDYVAGYLAEDLATALPACAT